MKKLTGKLAIICLAACLLYSLLNARALSVNLEQRHYPAFITELFASIGTLPFISTLDKQLHSFINRSSEFFSYSIAGSDSTQQIQEKQDVDNVSDPAANTYQEEKQNEAYTAPSDNIALPSKSEKKDPAGSVANVKQSDSTESQNTPASTAEDQLPKNANSVRLDSEIDFFHSTEYNRKSFSPTVNVEHASTAAEKSGGISPKPDVPAGDQLIAMGDIKGAGNDMPSQQPSSETGKIESKKVVPESSEKQISQNKPEKQISQSKSEQQEKAVPKNTGIEEPKKEAPKSIENEKKEKAASKDAVSNEPKKETPKFIENEKEIKSDKIPTKHLPAKVLLAGDSMMESVYVVVANRKQFKTPRIKYIFAAKHSTGLSTGNYYNWPEHMEDFLRKYHPDIVLIFLGTNDLQNIRYGKENYVFNSEKWKNKYRELSEKLISLCEDYHATPIWIGLPSMGTKQMQQWMPLISSLQKEACRNKQVPYVNTPSIIADGKGKFQTHYTLKNGKRILLRAKDKIHLSSDGTAVVMEQVFNYLNKIIDEEFLPDLPQPQEKKTSGKKK